MKSQSRTIAETSRADSKTSDVNFFVLLCSSVLAGRAIIQLFRVRLWFVVEIPNSREWRWIMNQGIKRSILRWIHIVFGIPIVGYIYSPFNELPNYAPVVRYVALPVMVVSGLWMWKGHVLRRLVSKRSEVQARGAAAD